MVLSWDNESFRNHEVMGGLSRRDLHIVRMGLWSDQGTVNIEADMTWGGEQLLGIRMVNMGILSVRLGVV